MLLRDYEANLPMLRVFLEMGQEIVVSRGDPARHRPVNEIGTIKIC